jgi:hypothetical protein
MSSWRFFTAYGLLEFRMTNLAPAEIGVVRRYLGQLTALELAIPGAGDNLDTDQASVWTRNRTETDDRARLFDEWRCRLAGFIGVPPGPALAGGGGRLIV